VMSDLLVALLALGATRCWIEYMESERGRDALAFGLLAAAAILTKGTGLFLALVPPIAIALTGRWRLLKRSSLYVAPLPVLLLAAPWMVLTYAITQEGMASEGFATYLREALPAYAKGTWTVLLPGLLAAALACAGRFRALGLAGSTWVAFIAANAIFTLLVPSGIDARYLLPAAVGCVLCAGLGAGARPRRAVLFLALLPLIAWAPQPVQRKQFEGMRAAADQTLAQSGRGRVLIVSDARGEGAFTAAIAARDPDRRWTVLRGSKELAESDWMGRGYRSRVESPEALENLLRELAVDVVFIDGSVPERHRTPHHRLAEAWATHPAVAVRYGQVDGSISRRADGSPVTATLLGRARLANKPARE